MYYWHFIARTFVVKGTTFIQRKLIAMLKALNMCVCVRIRMCACMYSQNIIFPIHQAKALVIIDAMYVLN